MRISIVLPAFNAERFLSQALDSVLAQTHKDYECIVVDDGSTDATGSIAIRFAERDSRIRVVRKDHGGVAGALNRGLSEAQERWIARMDADDVMEPTRLQRQLEFVLANPDLSVASALVTYINEQGHTVGFSRSRFTDRKTVASYVRRGDLVIVNHPAVLMRKSAVVAVGGYREQFVSGQDCDLWNRLLEHGYGVLVQPEYLLKYRIHPQSTVGRGVISTEQRLGWIRACLRCRRRGEPEISFGEFLRQQACAPWYSRLNRRRAEAGTSHYGRAVFLAAGRRYVPAIVHLLNATLLRPALVFDRLGPRVAGGAARVMTRWRANRSPLPSAAATRGPKGRLK